MERNYTQSNALDNQLPNKREENKIPNKLLGGGKDMVDITDYDGKDTLVKDGMHCKS